MPNPMSPVSPRSEVDSALTVAPTRARQTDHPAQPFREVLAGSVSLLLSGAEVATHVVAGPLMAAAVHDARAGAVSGISGSTAGLGSSGNSGDIQSLLQDGQASSMQLLALQQQIQNDSQQFSTVSNVMRAKYDTAKAAVSNIRA